MCSAVHVSSLFEGCQTVLISFTVHEYTCGSYYRQKRLRRSRNAVLGGSEVRDATRFVPLVQAGITKKA